MSDNLIDPLAILYYVFMCSFALVLCTLFYAFFVFVRSLLMGRGNTDD